MQRKNFWVLNLYKAIKIKTGKRENFKQGAPKLLRRELL